MASGNSQDGRGLWYSCHLATWRGFAPFAFAAGMPSFRQMSGPHPASSRPPATEALPRCAVCGTGSRQPPFRPDPPEQAPDLDLRPGEPVRSTMARWLQQCPGCGYAAPNITRAHPAAAQAVAAAPFRALLADQGYPPLARRLLAWAHVLEETGALHASAEATLHAAWVADDLGQEELSRYWRLEGGARGWGGAAAGRGGRRRRPGAPPPRHSIPSKRCASSIACAGPAPGAM